MPDHLRVNPKRHYRGPRRMRRSGRPKVVECLSGMAFRLLAAVDPPAFLFCAVRLPMPFARLPDHGQSTNRQGDESNHHRCAISHSSFVLLSCDLWSAVSFATLAANRRRCMRQIACNLTANSLPPPETIEADACWRFLIWAGPYSHLCRLLDPA